MTNNCVHHGAIEERLKAGEKEFMRIAETIDTFKKDMKEIANNFGEEAREMKKFMETMHETYRNQLADLAKSISVLVNGDAEKNIKGFDKRISDAETSISRIYKIGISAGIALLGVAGYFLRAFWAKMMDVMTAIENINKTIGQ